MVLALCHSLPNAVRLALLDEIGAMVFHDPVPKLPTELMLAIFSHLSPKDVLTSSAVSRPWRIRTHDERLWRECFVREGWIVDKGKMLEEEVLAKKMGVEVAERIMRGRAPGKADRPRLARRDSRKRPRDEAFSESESTEGPMEGVETTDPSRIAHGVGADGMEAASGSFSSDAGDIDSQPDMSDVRIEPSVFSAASDATEPKLSWSYLYKQRRRLESNWDNGKCKVFRLPHPKHELEGHSECVYTIQHHGNTLVSGSRDRSIRIWDLETCRLQNTLNGHAASVLCLQFDPRPGDNRDVIISGGSDNLVIVWQFSTGDVLHKWKAHDESVLNLRFDDRYLITCSKDKTIRIWNRQPIYPTDPLVPARSRPMLAQQYGADTLLPPYTLLDTLTGHQAAVNAVQINGDVIVSASGDRTIKSWDLHAGTHKKSYSGHSKGIACVQFDGRRIVSGSSDNSVRIFDYETTAEVACLEGHTSLVRTVQARFGDLDITTDEELLEESREADKNFLGNLDRNGEHAHASRRDGPRNAGSSRPQDMLSYGTKVPPGGGGSRWGRIVSGSYDESVIIWKRQKDGKWKPNQRLQQGAGQTARSTVRPPPQVAPLSAHQLNTIQQAQQVLQQTTNGLAPNNMAHAQQGSTGQNPLAALTNNMNAQMQALHGLQYQQNINNPPAAPAALAGVIAQVGPAAQPAAAPHAHHHHHHHHHNHAARPDTNRVFKLQFDARRIISCSQNKVVVGWDFANGDKDLEFIGNWSVETA